MTTTMWAPSAVLRALLTGCLVCAGLGAWAQNSIVAVTGSAQGDVETVRIEFAQPLAALPAAFVTQSPARIALDFAGVTGGVGRSTVDINQANVQSANVVQTDERSRVVLSLKRPASYALQMADRSLLVTLEPAASARAPEPAPNRVVAQRRTEAPLGAIDFRRAGEGAGESVRYRKKSLLSL